MKEVCVFEKSDYESGDGMLTYVWGPSLWHSLHTMSFNYPVKPTCQDKESYMKFIKSLKNVLPCKYCRQNLTRNLKETGFSIRDMENRETFSKFVFNLHNHINTMLNKKNVLTYDEVRERYENFRSRCSKTQKNVKKFKMKNVLKGRLSEKDKKCQNKIKETEKGCVTPLQGIKSKCVIRIVPKTKKMKTFSMDPRCRTKRVVKSNKK